MGVMKNMLIGITEVYFDTIDRDRLARMFVEGTFDRDGQLIYLYDENELFDNLEAYIAACLSGDSAFHRKHGIMAASFLTDIFNDDVYDQTLVEERINTHLSANERSYFLNCIVNEACYLMQFSWFQRRRYICRLAMQKEVRANG